MTNRDAAFQKALDLIQSHDALAGQDKDALRTLVFEKYVDDVAKDADRSLERSRFWHNTPLMIALTGLLTIGANFAVSYTRADQDLSGLLTKAEFDAAIKANNDRLSAELAEQRAQADAARSADSSQRDFQYKILTELLEIPDEETRANLLLFYVDAGAMEGLNTEPLRAMAKQSIRDTGGDPDAQVGVPSTREIPDRLSLLSEVLGAPGTTECDIPLETVTVPAGLFAGAGSDRPSLQVHEAVAPYTRTLLQNLAASPVSGSVSAALTQYPSALRGYSPFEAGENRTLSHASWGASLTLFVGPNSEFGGPGLSGFLGASALGVAVNPATQDLYRSAEGTGYRVSPILLGIGIVGFELTDATLRTIQSSGYQPWDGNCT